MRSWLFSTYNQTYWGTTIKGKHKYAAFISYAHADEAQARKLHNALETYPLPRGMDTEKRARLTPIFRDVTELTAHHSLSEKIRDAVETSRYLIVLCSPAAKASHWVNEEIRLFRSLHGENAILTVIVDGAPDTAFPPALLDDGREPLAADISGREGFKFGTTQLAASMLGVGLDRLVQRDQKRRRIRAQMITAASTALAIVMGGLAWNAVDARDDAQVSQAKAEVSRNEAEELVEYMLGDLKSELDAVGKLPILNGVGDKVADYYEDIPLSDMDDDRLARRSEARHLLGQVYLKQGLNDKSLAELQAAYDATEEIYQRNPDDPETIYTHAQSEYWMGELYHIKKNYLKSLEYWKNYNKFGQILYNFDQSHSRWLNEAAWGNGNLGLLYKKLEDFEKATQHYTKSVEYFHLSLKHTPNAQNIKFELANSLAGWSNTLVKTRKFSEARNRRNEQIKILSELRTLAPNNNEFKYRYIGGQLRLQRILVQKEKQCNLFEQKTYLNKLFKLSQFDDSNYDWKHDYVSHSYFFLTECPNWKFAPDLEFTLAKVLKFATENISPDDLTEELSELAQIRRASQ